MGCVTMRPVVPVGVFKGSGARERAERVAGLVSDARAVYCAVRWREGRYAIQLVEVDGESNLQA